MSRLSDIIQGAIDDAMNASGRLDMHEAAKAAIPKYTDEDRATLVEEATIARIKQAATRGKVAARAYASEQGEFPFKNLRRAHPVDTEGRVIVNTSDLSEMQFARIIEIREKGIADDQAYLKELRDAYRAVAPIWRQHADWTFGQCCAELIRRRMAS